MDTHIYSHKNNKTKPKCNVFVKWEKILAPEVNSSCTGIVHTLVHVVNHILHNKDNESVVSSPRIFFDLIGKKKNLLKCELAYRNQLNK